MTMPARVKQSRRRRAAALSALPTDRRVREETLPNRAGFVIMMAGRLRENRAGCHWPNMQPRSFAGRGIAAWS
jgi:hypothetical protein